MSNNLNDFKKKVDKVADEIRNNRANDPVSKIYLTAVKNILSDVIKENILSEKNTLMKNFKEMMKYLSEKKFDDKILEDIFNVILDDFNKYYKDEIVKAKDDRKKICHIQKIINIPSEYFKEWSNFLLTKGITFLGEQKVCERQSLTASFKGAIESQLKKYPPDQSLPKKEKRVENVTYQAQKTGSFDVIENYNRQQFNKRFKQEWYSAFLLYQPKLTSLKDEWLIDSVEIISSLAQNADEWAGIKPEKVDDLIILVQEVQFWLAQYQSDVLNSCSFSAPTSLRKTQTQHHSIFRDNVMTPLLKFVFLVYVDKGTLYRKLIRNLMINQTIETKFIPLDLWIKYVSIQFPLAAFHLFKSDDDLNQSVNHDLQLMYDATYTKQEKKGEKAISFLKEIQRLFVIDEPTQQIQESKYIRIENLKTCLNDDDIQDFFDLLKEKEKSDIVLIGSHFGEKLSDPGRALQKLTEKTVKPIKGFVVVRHVDGNHWITFYVSNSQKGPVTIFDPLRTDLDYDNDARNVVEVLRKFSKPGEFLVEPQPEIEYFFDKPIQKDATSCGLFSLLISQALFLKNQEFLDFLSRLSKENKTISEEDMRKFILDQLRKKSLIPLESLIKNR